MAGQGLFAVFDLPLYRQQGLSDRPQLGVEPAQIAFQGVALGLQRGSAKLVFAWLDPDRAGTPAVKTVGLGCDPVACGFAAFGRAVHTAQMLQLLDQPARQPGIKADVGQQRAGLRRRHGLAGADRVVAVALRRGKGVSLGQITGLVQQHHPAQWPQRAFDGGAPVFVGHLDHFGQKAVFYRLGLQTLAQAASLFGVGRRLLALQPLQVVREALLFL